MEAVGGSEIIEVVDLPREPEVRLRDPLSPTGHVSAARNNRRNPVKSALAAMSERASSAGVGVA
jgi:hypothetical protein